ASSADALTASPNVASRARAAVTFEPGLHQRDTDGQSQIATTSPRSNHKRTVATPPSHTPSPVGSHDQGNSHRVATGPRRVTRRINPRLPIHAFRSHHPTSATTIAARQVHRFRALVSMNRRDSGACAALTLSDVDCRTLDDDPVGGSSPKAT